MRNTNKFGRFALSLLLGAACLNLLSFRSVAEEELSLHRRMTADEWRCFGELFRARPFDYVSAEELTKFAAETKVGRADLKGNRQRHFIFLTEDSGYCGTAGCMMLIGERRRDGRCHLLDEGHGDGDAVILLDRRDHGYRRLLTPCEIYFDGKWYRQVREECPNADVHR